MDLTIFDTGLDGITLTGNFDLTVNGPDFTLTIKRENLKINHWPHSSHNLKHLPTWQDLSQLLDGYDIKEVNLQYDNGKVVSVAPLWHFKNGIMPSRNDFQTVNANENEIVIEIKSFDLKNAYKLM